MPLQNRVMPTGEIVAHAARGTCMGNRGILHDDRGRRGAARWRHRTWLVCRLAFRDRHRRVMTPGRYTELFFLDEAVALAAGHRPCFECRRAAFAAFTAAWAGAFGGARPRAAEVDRALHGARVDRRSRAQVRHRAGLDGLPDGIFVRLDGEATPYLVLGRTLRPFAPMGYGPARRRPRGVDIEVLTPAPTVAVVGAGYRPALHSSAAEVP